MKKIVLALILCVLMMLTLTGCRKGSDTATPAAAESPRTDLKTLGDAFALESEYNCYAYDDAHFIYVFVQNGIPTRVTADMTKEIHDRADSIDFFDEQREEKVREIVSSLELTNVEDLSAGIPSQETLNGLVGRKGSQMLEDGYEISGYYWDGGPESTYQLVKGLYEYDVKTDSPDGDSVDDFDGEAVFPNLTVKSIQYTGISYNCLELPPAD